ncbi:MAG: hypothetical protein HY235_29975 [Acidobacteria bacterium]|nr:hypothetical protein [Acidobacteriota bacterium]
MRWRLTAGLLLGTAVVAAQSDLPPELLLLAKIKLQAAENLQRLPNYTCLETVERSRRLVSSRKFQLIDVLRLEVGYVNNKEVFAWPGSEKFEEKEISDMVSGGAIGNGSFALHLRSVFLTNAATFTYSGERIREGRRAHRFEYEVPMLRSGYKLRVRPLEGIVGYKGAFWADAGTLDLLLLEITVTDIPPHLPISSGSESLEYARVPMGDRDFLLPYSSELVLTDLRGNESRNITRFNNCRQFSGESVLSFDEAPRGPAAEKRAPVRITLPEGLEFGLRLETAVESGSSAVGDAVHATVVRDVKQKGQVVVPKGAVVKGRLTRLERVSGTREPYWIVGIEFTRVEFENSSGSFRARMAPVSTPGLDFRVGDVERARVYTVIRSVDHPRIGILYMRGEKGRIPPGTLTNWRTELPSKEDQP